MEVRKSTSSLTKVRQMEIRESASSLTKVRQQGFSYQVNVFETECKTTSKV